MAEGLIKRINRFLRGASTPATPATDPTPDKPEDTSTTGTMSVSMINAWTKSIFNISSERVDVYDTAEEMDDTVEEVSVGLDKLASTALAGREGSQESFEVRYADSSDQAAIAVIDEMLDATALRSEAYTIIREYLLHGDKFVQPVVDRSLRIVRLMQMPVRSMHRNEDETGRLKTGESEGEWAFEQRYEKSHKFIAGFYPWQMLHLRWNRRGRSKYGRSLLYSARASFKKLRAMEEALTINWLTRAFARLVFLLDHTGKSQKEREVLIKKFQDSLLTRKMPDGSTGRDPLTVVKDIYLSTGYHQGLSEDGKLVRELTDVKVADTSSAGYRDLSPVKYYLRKVVRPLRIPPAFLGIEDEVNAKATLDAQKEEYAAFLRWIQTCFSGYLVELFSLALVLQGIDPATVEYQIVWPAPFQDDELLLSRIELAQAQADQLRMGQGVIDATWIATQRLKMSEEEWAAVQERIISQAQAEVGVEPAGTQEEKSFPGVKALLEEAQAYLTEEGLAITPANVTRYLLEQGGGEGPPPAFETADEAYRQGLQAIYDKWSVETVEALADIDPDDSEEFERKLEDALLVLLMLLHQHGESNLNKAVYLGYGDTEVGIEGLKIIQAEIENNYHYLETSMMSDIRERIARDVEDFRDELRSGRTDEAIALLLAMLATRKAHLDQYAGQYWHAIWEGWVLREQQATEKRVITWNLDPMAKHCPDCLEFAGEYADMNQLLAATGGILPGLGTQCDGYCRCWLDGEE